ncbi:MAG: hypothetical protein DRO76_05380 [Candidatus Altiarchaeales archaeon]|nr:MAG: hypothetical protein DRO76_05380 [Candidatus Altiarchaeales archaeon]
MKTDKKAIVLVLFSTLLTSVGQIFLKLGSIRLSLDILSQITNYALILGFICYALGAFILIIALRYGELTVLYPLYATSYVWVSLLSPRLFPTDSMNPLKWLGILVIIAGIILIGKGSRK